MFRCALVLVLVLVLALACLAACASPAAGPPVVTLSISALGAEGRLLSAQLVRFRAANPDVRVELRDTPDAGDQRHQLYVQWLNAGSAVPDVLQLDVVWTPELAAAGWILPLDRFGPDAGAFFPATLRADRWQGALYAVPWFVDVGMLYYRADLVPRAPETWDELFAFAAAAQARTPGIGGFVFQGSRYEGLVCSFLELLGARGGQMIDDSGRITVDSPAARAALGDLKAALDRGVIPAAVLTFAEEQTRFAFQNGRAVFMRNWPYALPLVEDPLTSRVAGRVAIAPMPSGPDGRRTAALGGAQLAINARSLHPEAAWRLVAFLTAPEQMRERARVVGQYPTRPALYDDPGLLRIVEAAEPRPVTPLYTALSERLHIALHRALSGQVTPAVALVEAARTMREAVDDSAPAPPASPWPGIVVLAALLAAGGLVVRRLPPSPRGGDTAWPFVAPAVLVLVAILVFPLAWSVWESLHAHDLRFARNGHPYIGFRNYAAAFADPRWRAAVLHTVGFTVVSVALELILGMCLALVLDRAFRRLARGIARTAALLPWALPTVVAALVWRFFFEGAWLADPGGAWVPIILADVWKTTPFTALLLLAGLQGIDPAIEEAASIDGADGWRKLVGITLPLLLPTLGVAALLRALDAFRVFDLIYVMTGGGPGSATEPLGLYTFHTLLAELRFGYGAAQSVLVFLATFALALLFVRVVGVGEKS